MPFPDFFKQFGVYSHYEFLSPEFCQKLHGEMEVLSAVPGTIWNPDGGEKLSEEAKKRKEYPNISDASVSEVNRKLGELMPEISERFEQPLTGVQPVKFTRYDTGDYYRIHTDITNDPNAPELLKERKVSVIVFLSQESETPDEGDYCGGNLTFYGLLGEQGWNSVGLPLESEQGLLIAFRPDIPHEVTVVTHGTRYTITTWYK
jgi:predicted 2-oxoglutarate/Fe(II)-dependent dioxygenase YbiX